MQIAIAVGTLLLGGWVLNTPTDDQQTGVTEQAQSVEPLPATPRRPGLMKRGTQDEQAGRTHGRSTKQGEQQQGDEQATRQARTRRQQMQPLAPTDVVPPGAEAYLGQPASPTSAAPQAGIDGGGDTGPQGTGRPLGSIHPMAPTAGRGGGSAYRPGTHGAAGVMGNRPSGGTATFMAPPSAMPSQEKAFAGYRLQSGVSPWMNIFRRDSLGTVDNYTTLVRPELDQRYLNQQFGREIGGLESNIRKQGMNLQQMNQQQQNRTLQGVGTPQFYMNYGNFYPGYGQ